MALQYVKNQTLEICLEAVKQNGNALQYVKNKTPEICLEAVKQKGYILQYVKNQTDEIYLAVVKQNIKVLQLVTEDLKTLEFYDAILEHNPDIIKQININHYRELKLKDLLNEELAYV